MTEVWEDGTIVQVGRQRFALANPDPNNQLPEGCEHAYIAYSREEWICGIGASHLLYLRNDGLYFLASAVDCADISWWSKKWAAAVDCADISWWSKKWAVTSIREIGDAWERWS